MAAANWVGLRPRTCGFKISSGRPLSIAGLQKTGRREWLELSITDRITVLALYTPQNFGGSETKTESRTLPPSLYTPQNFGGSETSISGYPSISGCTPPRISVGVKLCFSIPCSLFPIPVAALPNAVVGVKRVTPEQDRRRGCETGSTTGLSVPGSGIHFDG